MRLTRVATSMSMASVLTATSFRSGCVLALLLAGSLLAEGSGGSLARRMMFM